jgi:hypothetical protein
MIGMSQVGYADFLEAGDYKFWSQEQSDYLQLVKFYANQVLKANICLIKGPSQPSILTNLIDTETKVQQ